jgi:2-keto-4-pentenoate hydratase/2-oxohepta-3-ene-1,7-dioic acid hydratase in catechol pathway
MQLVVYRQKNTNRTGLLFDDQVFDLASILADDKLSTMQGVLDDWPMVEGRLFGLKLEDGIPLADVSLRAPVSGQGTVFCAGANYRDHSVEMAALHNRPPPVDPHTLGERPWHFIKAAQSITHPGATIHLPSDSQEVDWEAELVVIIGKTCRNATMNNALEHVLGYTIANDLSARDLSRRNAPDGSPFKFDWLSHKSFDGSLPLGPAITLAKDVADPQSLAITLQIDGATKQDSSTSEMTFSIAEQIVHLSRNLTLRPGDLLLTGTPAGVGAAKREFLQGGETVVVTIEKIGTLTNLIASRS